MSLNPVHKLWRRLPAQMRVRAFSVATAAIAPRPEAAARGGTPIAIAGMLRSASGLGEGARLMFSALREAGHAPDALDLSAAFGQADLPMPADMQASNAKKGGTLVVHINAPYIPYALARLGRRTVKGRRIVGYWAWELPALPKAWQLGFPFVHEIWVPSRFVRDAVAAASQIPVHVIPHALHNATIDSAPPGDLGLSAGALIVLSVCNLGSSLSRKNPLATIAAFRKAFGNAPDRQLVLKLVDRDAAPNDRRKLDAAIRGAPNICIIDRFMTRREMSALIASSDIVISLHRSEGFGLVLAEAMQRAKPVVATGWSGNLDFMSTNNSALVDYTLVPATDPDGTYDLANQSWAEPDVKHAAAWLSRLAENHDLRRHMGEAAASNIVTLLEPSRIARLIDLRLTEAARDSAAQLPDLSK